MGRYHLPIRRNPLPVLLCALAALTCAPAALQAQDGSAQAEARTAYAAGVEAFGSANYERAHKQFSLAESKFPSPNIELMLARSLIKLDKLVEAHRMLSVARDNAGQTPKYANAASAARDELAELDKRLAVLHLHVAAARGDETVSINGEQLAPLAWASPIIVAPGTLRVELTRPGAPSELKQLSLAPGASATLELKIRPTASALVPMSAPAPLVQQKRRPEAPAPSAATAPAVAAATAPAASGGGRNRQLRGFSYALAGVGVLGISSFAIFGTMSHSQFAKLEAGCPESTRCDPALRDNATRGQTYQTLANVALVAGAAAATTAVTLWLVSLPEERAELAVTPGSVQLRGSF
jgi:hypothetical protein